MSSTCDSVATTTIDTLTHATARRRSLTKCHFIDNGDVIDIMNEDGEPIEFKI
ncbi:MAG: hypothetical protein WCG02_01365 [Candidatus Taylorbacteria bacterium]